VGPTSKGLPAGHAGEGSGGETIAAIATAAGRAGIGVVRLSGPRAIAIVVSLMARERPLVDRQLHRVRLVDAGGAPLDDVLCVAMRGPRSFTGEDVVEIHGHGGGLNLGRLLGAVLERGARLAGPGEFSRRALRAGKLDRVQAEALLAVTEAASARALAVAQEQLAGGLGARIEGVRRAAVDGLADLEARLEFPDEGLGAADRAAQRSALAAAAAACDALVASFAVGRALREGIQVALRGPVNAGKSSLFNALLGRERALVAAEPGTTRDFLEAAVVWDGVPVTLIDTAGERATDSALEARGIDLGARRAAAADLELWLEPGADGAGPVGASPDGARRLVVRSKCDLGEAGPSGEAIAVSARTGAGLAALRAEVLRIALAGGALEGEAIVTTERQRRGLAEAGAALARAVDGIDRGRPDEVVALELREALEALDGVLGRGVDDEVLDSLFARFCIGK
jgi:tRNA modification GTPase